MVSCFQLLREKSIGHQRCKAVDQTKRREFLEECHLAGKRIYVTSVSVSIEAIHTVLSGVRKEVLL